MPVFCLFNLSSTLGTAFPFKCKCVSVLFVLYWYVFFSLFVYFTQLLHLQKVEKKRKLLPAVCLCFLELLTYLISLLSATAVPMHRYIPDAKTVECRALLRRSKIIIQMQRIAHATHPHTNARTRNVRTVYLFLRETQITFCWSGLDYVVQ